MPPSQKRQHGNPRTAQLDMNNEELFPSLAAAAKIEKEEKAQVDEKKKYAPPRCEPYYVPSLGLKIRGASRKNRRSELLRRRATMCARSNKLLLRLRLLKLRLGTCGGGRNQRMHLLPNHHDRLRQKKLLREHLSREHTSRRT